MQEAAEMVVKIDRTRATQTNKILDAAMQRRRWFTRKPVFTTHTQALQELGGTLALEDVEIRGEAQRQHCQELIHLCQMYLTNGDDGEFIEVNEEDIRMLGYNKQRHLMQAFDDLNKV